MRAFRIAAVSTLTGLVAACTGPTEAPQPSTLGASTAAPSATAQQSSPTPTPSRATTTSFSITEHETFDEPWAMAALPGTDTFAITERGGALKLRDADGVRVVSGVPETVVRDQGGLGDIIAAPSFAQDGTVYLSWADGTESLSGAVVAKATLDVEAATLSNVERIWEQSPRIDGGGHYAHRLAIHDDLLYITSGDRRQFTPAQEFDPNLGKIIRLTLDGDPAPGNPFQDNTSISLQFWSLGHRNPLGLAFDSDGRLWSSEMGPQGGDELNLIKPGLNYGWPEASNGSNYDGSDIPDHAPGDGFEAPKVSWNPSISPGSLMIYQGDLFAGWKGDALIGALSGEALIRVDLEGEDATLAANWPMGARIREVEEAPDGAIWLLQDGPGATLLELRPS